MSKQMEKLRKEKTIKKAPFSNATEIKFQESPIERALKLSSEEVLARAIKDLIDRDRLN